MFNNNLQALLYVAIYYKMSFVVGVHHEIITYQSVFCLPIYYKVTMFERSESLSVDFGRREEEVSLNTSLKVSF